MEVQTQLVIAKKLGFGSLERIAEADALSDEVGKMLSAMIKRLDAATIPPVKP